MAKFSDIDFQSVGLESKNTSFMSPGTVSEPTVALQGISAHHDSEDNGTSCEITALAKHHKRKL